MVRALKKKEITLLLNFFVALFLFIPTVLFAQNFNEGLTYYQQKNYKKALSVFKNIHDPEGYLFAGKSYYALGQYNQADSSLQHVTSDAASQVYNEALYTSALVDFQQKKFGHSLNTLLEVSNASSRNNLTSGAKNLYTQILNYLTADQREKIFSENVADQVKFELLKTGLGKVSYSDAQNLYNSFTRNIRDPQWLQKAKQFQASIGSSKAYQQKYGNTAGKLKPPKGTVYNIGVALPRYKPNEQGYGVVKGLYFGALLAAKEYNNKNRRARAYLHFINTGTSTDSARAVVRSFAKQGYGDVIIGPLYSRQAGAMISPASQYRIPVIAPLANADIGSQNSFLFQANPTSAIQGKIMAKYAIQELELNNFTVIADKNSTGAISAKAFIKEAKQLNAKIAYNFIKNLQTKYQFSKYTRYFSASSKPIKVVYAPLNNPNAMTLIDLLLRKARSVNRKITILGSQEWGNHKFKPSENKNLDIYFSESTHQNQGKNLKQFKNKYRQQFKRAGNEYAIIGYDVTRFILKTLKKVGNPQLLRSAIPQQPMYHGLARNIDFDGGNINKAVKIMHVDSTGHIQLQR